MKRMFSILFSLILILAMLPVVLLAAENVHYIDENGVEQTVAAAIEVKNTDRSWGTINTESWYLADGNLTINSTVTINGNVHLILADDSNFSVKDAYNAGLRIPAGSSLCLYGQRQGTGILQATGGNNGAGIGGLVEVGGGHLTINGGKITSSGGYGNGAGIGGISEVEINGGVIIARGNGHGAGIGSGLFGKYCLITINGGDVTASSDQSAGIGCGYFSEGGSISINGGKIVASSNHYGAGIGGCPVNITGGKITANNYGVYDSSEFGGGAGIGSNSYGDQYSINISGGEIIAYSQEGAGIGGGQGSYPGTINISGGSITATSSEGAGIGSGKDGQAHLPATITISGGDCEGGKS